MSVRQLDIQIHGNYQLRNIFPHVERVPGVTYDYCCGADVSSVTHEFVGKRQVFDIPEIKVHVTEHQVFKKRCNACGHETTGSFPHKPKPL